MAYQFVEEKLVHQAHGGPLKNLMAAGIALEEILHLPRVNLNDRQLCDLELLVNGGFSPLEEFLNEENYRSVVERMRLADGTLWPLPVVLDVDFVDSFVVGSSLLLCDSYGKPLAVFEITSVYEPDKTREAELVYGTKDVTHPGVRYLFEETKRFYLGGRVRGIAPVEHHDFPALRFSPRELRTWFRDQGWEKVIAFQTRNPLHRAHFEIIRRAAETHSAKVLLHPVVGLTKEGDVDYITRIRCYQRLQAHYMRDFTKLALLPLAMRMAGPREAVWHAIIRKNYGCTHFIVGRDHAGPGQDTAGRPFYEPYAAQKIVLTHAQEIGIEVIPVKEVVYVEEAKGYMPVDEVRPHHTVKRISGTEVRRRLIAGEEIPEWFSFPEIIVELRRAAERERQKGMTIFFTGLPSAGKSTIARILTHRLLELQNRKVTLLDGDIIRQNLSRGLGFSREDRNANIERIGFVANEITKHGGIAVCAAVAPYEEARQKNRKLVNRHGRYLEVYVATPLAVCRNRDVKGLYRKAETGLIKNFTGVDDPYEPPAAPDLILDTIGQSAHECAEAVLRYLADNSFI